MRLQTLTIHNIASIEDATIAFDQAPLSSAEVFLITGKTGAGKSTILDAISLALYATTPRLKGTLMQGSTQDDDSVKINDPRQIMRRNTGEAYACLQFLGSDNQPYEAQWYVKRAHKKPTGALQPRQWQIINQNTGQRITKEVDVRNEINRVVGLDFSQFCRTTMLAQGEFTRFLNSPDDQKAEILEKITGVDIYSKLGTKIFEITTSKRDEYDRAQSQLKTINTLAPQEIQALNEELQQIEKDNFEVKKQSDETSAKIQWLKTQHQLSQTHLEAVRNYQQATEALKTMEFTDRELIVKQWQTTIDPRAWLQAQSQAQKELTLSDAIIQRLHTNYAHLLGQQKQFQYQTEQLRTKLSSINADLQELSPKAAIYQNHQTIIAQLRIITTCQEKIRIAKNDIDQEQKKLATSLIPDYEKAQKAAGAIESDCQQMSKQVQAQCSVVQMLNLNDIRRQYESTSEMLRNLTLLSEKLLDLETQRRNIVQHRQQLADAFSQLDADRKKLAEIQVHCHDAQIVRDTCNKNLLSQRDTIDDFAQELRLKLHVGDVCPVCRQIITTELPHEESLQKLVNGLQKQYVQAEQQYSHLLQQSNELSAQIQSQEQILLFQQQRLDQDQTVALASQRALLACQTCGFQQISDATPQAIQDYTQQYTNRLQQLAQQITYGESMEKSLQGQQQQLDQLRDTYQKHLKNLQEAEGMVNRSRTQILSIQAIIDTNQGYANEAESVVVQHVSQIQWSVDWRQQPQAFADMLTIQAQHYANQQEVQQQLVLQVERAESEGRIIDERLADILLLMPTWADTIAINSDLIPDLLKVTNTIYDKLYEAITQRKGAVDCLARYTQLLDDYQENPNAVSQERLLMLSNYSAATIQEYTQYIRQHRDHQIQAHAVMQKAEEALTQHQVLRPDFADFDTLDTLAVSANKLQTQLSALAERRGAINQLLAANNQAEERSVLLRQQCQAAEADYNRWYKLNELLGDAKGSRFRKIAQSYVLASLIRSANRYLRTLTDRYTLAVTPGTFVIMLTDAYQSYVSRAASTISGGESFLVSLSLALALSDIGSQLSIDTLFIDEGFGTLSGEPLQRAINTLRSLHHHAGRHVGIISHVEELQERIPVQIQVRQEGNESSSTIVVTTA